MDRRNFLKSTVVGTAALGVAAKAFGIEQFYPVKVDGTLFQTINKAKDPANKTALEKSHAPFITAPAKVASGEPFMVEVSIGENLHPMGPAHWIEFIELNIGNEPAGRVDFQSKGYLKPKATFTVVLTKESAPGGRVTLVAHQRCNLHGYWEGSKDIEVA
ncbi:MAG: desulfoferrodoxin family protein [Thermodesulfovibrionales bacterium]|jgi:superoxide reductase